jgi:hypothetical protein
MASRWRKVLWGIALVAFLIGVGRALIHGFWGVSQDCHAWVNSHGYQLVQNDWCAKNRGFAVGTLPAMGMIVYISRHPGGRDAAGG